jgi:phenylpropionate dioxygenase-like ring-hydroxylating dioxygenase large terminal subunit
MYLENAWYVAAWAEEIGRKLLTRTICERPILLYRKENGSPVAIANRCPHRFAPLDRGRLKGDAVQCGYHGMVFGERGKCIHNPHHGGHIAPAMKVHSYPVIERHALVWLWIGDPERADPALIPDFSCHTDPSFVNVHGVIAMQANYQLITDNLLDLTHGDFVHEGLLGSEALTISGLETQESGDTIWANRWCPDGAPPPIFNDLLMRSRGTPNNAPVDQWYYMRWDAPGHLLLDVGATPTGKSREDGFWTYGTDIITPIDATHSYYFWAVSRNQFIETAAIDGFFRQSIEGAFMGQDQPMIEAQQRMIGHREIDDMAPVAIRADLPLGKARRVMKRLIANQGAGRVPTPGHTPLMELVRTHRGTRNPVAPVV